MVEVTCKSIGVMSTCTDMAGGVLGELTGGDGEEVESAQVSRSMPFYQAIPNEGSSPDKLEEGDGTTTGEESTNVDSEFSVVSD